MPQKVSKLPTRSTYQKDTDNTREFKGTGGKGGPPGGKPTKQTSSQVGPSNKGRK